VFPVDRDKHFGPVSNKRAIFEEEHDIISLGYTRKL